MHSTLVARSVHLRNTSLVHLRVFHSQRKLKYLFIHFRYISCSQLYFFFLASFLFSSFKLEIALTTGIVAKRTSYMILHFRDGEKLEEVKIELVAGEES